MILRYVIYFTSLIIGSCLMIIWQNFDLSISNIFFDGHEFYKANASIRCINLFIEILGFMEAFILIAVRLVFWYDRILRNRALQNNELYKRNDLPLDTKLDSGINLNLLDTRIHDGLINSLITKLTNVIITFDHKADQRSLFIVWACFIGPLFLVHLTKWLFGRARPFQTTYFGGNDIFTPAFTMSKACFHSCSFVSGHAAIGFLFYVLYFAYRDDNKRLGRFFFWLATALGISFGLIRIMSGAHFFSDVLMSGLLVYGTSMVLYDLWWKRKS